MRKVRVCAIVAGLSIVLLVSAAQAVPVCVDAIDTGGREPVISGRNPSVAATTPGDCITQIDCITLALNPDFLV